MLSVGLQCESKKGPMCFPQILGKYWPIFEILSQLQEELNLLSNRIGFHGNRFCLRQ
jgi:hypothetical protein